MSLKSEPGKGTSVTVRLPEAGIVKAESDADAAFLAISREAALKRA